MEHCISMVGLNNPHTPMFEDLAKMGKKTIAFALTWPGYEHIDWVVDIPIMRPSGVLITRGELAAALANQFRNFVNVSA